MSGMPIRRCTRCLEYKPLNDEHFSRRGEVDRKGEFLSRCKPCHREREREKYRNGAGAGGCWQTKRIGDPNYVPGPKPCDQCCDITDRRPRIGLCSCGEAYAEEPPLELADFIYKHRERIPL